jgi:hypothetical protein
VLRSWEGEAWLSGVASADREGGARGEGERVGRGWGEGGVGGLFGEEWWGFDALREVMGDGVWAEVGGWVGEVWSVGEWEWGRGWLGASRW